MPLALLGMEFRLAIGAPLGIFYVNGWEEFFSETIGVEAGKIKVAFHGYCALARTLNCTFTI